MKHPIHVTSEIGELQTVLLKRPGKRSGKLDARLFAAIII